MCDVSQALDSLPSMLTVNVLGTGGNVGANGYVTIGSNPTVHGNVAIGNATPSLIPSSCCTATSSPACGTFSVPSIWLW